MIGDPKTVQPTLPNFPPSAPFQFDEEVPSDIQQAMKILAGDVQGITDDLEVPQTSVGYSGKNGVLGQMNAQQRWQAAMLRKHEIEKAKQEYYDFSIEVVDILKPEGRSKWAEVMNLVGKVDSGLFVEVDRPRYVTTGTTLSIMVIIKTWRVKKVVPESSDKPIYTKISPQLQEDTQAGSLLAS